MSPKLHRTLKNLFRVFLILFGNALYSLAIVAFILPSGIITGGTTGLALASAHWFHTPITAFVLCFNILTFLLGFFVLGWKFAATTLLSTFFYPILLAGAGLEPIGPMQCLHGGSKPLVSVEIERADCGKDPELIRGSGSFYGFWCW